MTGQYERHVFVCTNDFACTQDGPAVEIRRWLKAQIKQAGLKDSIRANKSGCLSQCGHGPMIVVYPENVWYAHVDLAGAGRIWHEHLLGGRPVKELRYQPRSLGGNALPRRPEGHEGATVVDVDAQRFDGCPACPSPRGHPRSIDVK